MLVNSFLHDGAHALEPFLVDRVQRVEQLIPSLLDRVGEGTLLAREVGLGAHGFGLLDGVVGEQAVGSL